MNLIKKYLEAGHRIAAKSEIAAYLAAKTRSQCDLILRKRFSANDMDPAKNGEHLLLKTIMPYCHTYFDVGANKGDWTNFILENKPDPYKCYLFEPGRAAFAYLQKRFNSPSIELKNVAISSTEGTADFYEEENAGEMSSMLKGWARETSLISVTCSTIDQEITENKILFLDFLKIDVEGFDLKVIEGAMQSIKEQKIGIIQFEYNGSWLSAGSSLFGAYQIFNANNYKTYLIRKNGLVHYDINTYGDFYSFSNFVAVSQPTAHLIERLIIK